MLRDRSNIIPLDPEEFLAAHVYAGWLGKMSSWRKSTDLPTQESAMAECLSGFAVGCYFRD